MGGKKQQAQRTKNNTKPSSSGRSAEMVQSSPSSSSFASFKTPQYQTKFVAPVADVLDPNLDPNFQVLFKKMNKKDPTTRYKALQEFIVQCNQSEANVVTDALPSWVRIYSNLVVDLEHRVREAAQNAHRAIVGKVGRNLAPFIKQIAPLWFISQYDTHAPAASAASRAFKEAFPPHKIVDVITFCQAEILQYISENLLAQAPIVFNKKENKQMEEKEARYERIVVCCLNGYGLFLTKIPLDKLDSIKEINNRIVSSVNFWKFCRYKAGTVRAAWFSLLSIMCQHVPVLLENEQKRAINCVLIHVNDYDPVALPAAWEATLQIVNNFPNCWEHVNIEKFFTPKLLSILNHGGQGNASLIYPNLLPLLSRVPDSMIEDKLDFFQKVFASFITGFKQSSVVQSLSESEAVATSFNECIRYVILQNADDLNFCYELSEFIIKAANAIMLEPSQKHIVAPFYTSLTQTLLHWNKNEKNNPNYVQLGERFWEKIVSISIENIDSNIHDKGIIQSIYNNHYNFIIILNEPGVKKKKKMKVQFVTDVDKDAPKKTEETSVSEMKSSEIGVKVSSFVEKVGEKYFSIVFGDVNGECKICTINHLWNITKTLPNEQIGRLMKSAKMDLSEIVKTWLQEGHITSCALVGFVFNTIDHLESDEKKTSVLSLLLECRPDETLQESMKAAIYDAKPKPGLCEWLQSSSVRSVVEEILKKINIESETNPIFQYCLMTNKSGDFILGSDTVSAILNILSELLKRSEVSIENANTIIQPLFSIRNHQNLESLSEEILHILEYLFRAMVIQKNFNVSNIWQSGIVLFSSSESTERQFSQHIENCASLISQYLNYPNEEIYINGAVKVSFMLLNAIVQGDKEVMNTSGKEICKRFLSTVLDDAINNWEKEIVNVCRTIETLDGKLPYQNKNVKNGLFIQKGPWDPLHNLNIESYLSSLFYCVKYMTILMDAQYGEENADDELVFEHLHLQFTSEHFSELFDYLAKITHGLRLCRPIMESFVNTKQCHSVYEIFNEITPDLKELIQRLKDWSSFKLFCEKSATDSLWENTLKILEEEFFERKTTYKKDDSFHLEEITPESLFRLRKRMENREIAEKNVENLLESIISFYNENCQTELECMDGNELCLNSEIMWFLLSTIKFYPSSFNNKHEDFILLKLATLIEKVHDVNSHRFTIEFIRFVTSVCHLHDEFASYCVTTEKQKLLDEWEELFASDSYDYLAQMWTRLAEKTLDSNFDHVGLKYLTTLSHIMTVITSVEFRIRCLSYWNDFKNTMKWLQIGTGCIISPYIPVQFTCYHLLSNIVTPLVKLDSACDEQTLNKLSCHQLLSRLTETHNVVTALLQDYHFSTSCTIAPCSESFTYTWAYLLLWSLLLKLCYSSDTNTRYVYTLWIKQQELIGPFMQSVVRLMPDFILTNTKLNNKSELFVKPPLLNFGICTSESLSNFSCWLYSNLLRTLPAVVRLWCGEADPKFYSFIEKMTVTHVSPVICDDELKTLKEHNGAFENMKVQTYPSAREVSALYSIEDTAMELAIKLANNHPLSPPKVEIIKGFTTTSQSKFVMQLTIFLTHQNGSLWDALMLWKSNLDRKFEGIEECYICFSIVHTSTQQLPKVSCQTCKKKFHSYCLMRWFMTSNKSTCPICRNHF